jgi:hypothetical protein
MLIATSRNANTKLMSQAATTPRRASGATINRSVAIQPAPLSHAACSNERGTA